MNLKKLKTAAQLFVVVCIIAFASCKKEQREKPFDIKIDRIEIWHESAVARADDTIKIRLYGYIGPNKCYKLYYDPLFYQEGNTNNYRIEAFGIYEANENGTPCNPVESLLDHELIFFPKAFEPGWYFLKVKIPNTDDFVIIDSLRVR